MYASSFFYQFQSIHPIFIEEFYFCRTVGTCRLYEIHDHLETIQHGQMICNRLINWLRIHYYSVAKEHFSVIHHDPFVDSLIYSNCLLLIVQLRESWKNKKKWFFFIKKNFSSTLNLFFVFPSRSGYSWAWSNFPRWLPSTAPCIFNPLPIWRSWHGPNKCRSRCSNHRTFSTTFIIIFTSTVVLLEIFAPVADFSCINIVLHTPHSE